MHKTVKFLKLNILEIICQPQIGIVRRLAANISSGQGESSEFSAFGPIWNTEATGHLQVLRDVPGGIGLQDSRRIFDVVDGGEKNLEQRVQLYLNVAA